MQRHRHNVKVSKLLVGLRPYRAYTKRHPCGDPSRTETVVFWHFSGLMLELGNCWTYFMGSAQVDVGVSDDKDKVILQIVFSTTSPISI